MVSPFLVVFSCAVGAGPPTRQLILLFSDQISFLIFHGCMWACSGTKAGQATGPKVLLRFGPLGVMLPESDGHIQGLLRNAMIIFIQIEAKSAHLVKPSEIALLVQMHLENPVAFRQGVAIRVSEACPAKSSAISHLCPHCRVQTSHGSPSHQQTPQWLLSKSP